MNIHECKEWLNKVYEGRLLSQDPEIYNYYELIEEHTYNKTEKYSKVTIVTFENIKLMEINFKNNESHGASTCWDGDDNKMWEINFKDGKMHGKATIFDDGQKIIEDNYSENMLNGTCIGWENGKKVVEEKYKDDEILSSIELDVASTDKTESTALMSNICRIWYPRTLPGMPLYCGDGWIEFRKNELEKSSAQVKKEVEVDVFIPGDKPFTGTIKSIHPNGNVRKMSYYLSDKEHGLTTTWDEDGKKILEANFKDGKQDGLTVAWDHKKGHIKESFYKDGRRNGTHTVWNVKGNKEAIINYKDDQQDGLFTVWDEDGNKVMESIFKNGEIVDKKFFSKT